MASAPSARGEHIAKGDALASPFLCKKLRNYRGWLAALRGVGVRSEFTSLRSRFAAWELSPLLT